MAIFLVSVPALSESIKNRTDPAPQDSSTVQDYMGRYHEDVRLQLFDTALKNINAAIALDPMKVEYLWERARLLYFSFNDKKGAFEDLNAAVALAPNNPTSYWTRIRYYDYEKNVAGTISDLTKLASLNPDTATSALDIRHQFLRMSNDLIKSGNFSDAIQTLDTAISEYPESSDLMRFYEVRGYAKACKGDHAGAIADLDKAIEIDKSRATAFNTRCASRNELGDFSRASEDCVKAIAIDPQLANAHKHLAIAKINLGQEAEGISELDKAIELRPDYVAALAARAQLHEKNNERDAAIDKYKKALKAPGRSGSVDDLRAKDIAGAALNRLNVAIP